MRRLVVLAVLLVAAACGKKSQEDAPAAEPLPSKASPPPQPPSPLRRGGTKPIAGDGEVELTFSGAVTARLQGTGALCRRFDPPKDSGAMFGVEAKTFDAADDFRFQLVVAGDAEWAAPKILVNHRTPQGNRSYAWAGKGRVDVPKDLSGLTIDGVLEGADGGKITVQGSIRCPKRP
jgi:hypothetical protein